MSYMVRAIRMLVILFGGAIVATIAIGALLAHAQDYDTEALAARIEAIEQAQRNAEQQRQMDEYNDAQARITQQMNRLGDDIVRCIGTSTC